MTKRAKRINSGSGQFCLAPQTATVLKPLWTRVWTAGLFYALGQVMKPTLLSEDSVYVRYHL